jgi:RHS repeat-associated protein
MLRPAARPAVGAQVLSRPDVVSARVTARAQGSRVEVEPLRDETSTTWVNPDGSLSTEQHGAPIRYRDDAGVWRDVDLTMVQAADGTVGPKGHPLGLSLAGASKAAGGAAKGTSETDLAFARQGGGGAAGEVTFGWGGGTLGAPVLAGTTATYRNVRPGMDLVVDARRTGYELHLVINTAAALQQFRAGVTGRALAWEIPVRTKGLSARGEKDGSVSFVDSGGRVVSVVTAPVAWDAVMDGRSGNRVNESPVAMTVAQQGPNRALLTLTPDQGWLLDPARVFPVTIDPTYAAGANTIPSIDAYVSSAFPSANYASSTELRVGTYDGGGDKYRSFLKFGLANFKGLDVISAALSLYEFHSWSCTATPFYVYNSNVTTAAVTWNTQPTAPTQYGSVSVAKGYSSSCAAGRVSVPITTLVDAWSKGTATEGWMRLSASETDSTAWKKFYSVESAQDPYITFTYNRKPNAAAAPTMDPVDTPAYVDPRDGLTWLFTSNGTPRFFSSASDPDGSSVAVTFEVHSSTAGTAASKVSSCTTGLVASGARASCVPGTVLANNTPFWVRAAVNDDRGLWNGTWSAWTRFGTAYDAPPKATVACPGYANGSWTDDAPGSDVTCTVKATGIPNDWSTPGYVDLTVDGVVKPRLKITPTNDANLVATTVTIPRTAKGAHTIVATSVARTLKTAPPTTYSFGWGGASLSLPSPGTASSGKIAVTAGGPPRGTSPAVTGKIQWRVAGSGNESTGWTDGPAVAVTNNAGGAPGASDPVKVSSSFALSSAVREAGASADLNARVPVLLDVQVCFSYAGVAMPQCTWSESPRSVTRLPHAFGDGYPTADAGPGQVALYTGEFNTTATDVSVPGYAGDLSLSRSHLSLDGDGTAAGWPADPVTSVFGPGWTANLVGPDAGAAAMQVIDNTRQDGTIVLVDDQGEPLVFQTKAKNRGYSVTVAADKSSYLPATADTAAAGTVLTITNGTPSPGASMQMTLTEPDGTVTTWAPVAYSAAADTAWVPVSVNEPGQLGSTSFGHDSTGRVTRILAAVPPNDATPPAAAVTCPTSGALVKGCRGLDISYAATTTATPASPGDYTGRVTAITATLWDPHAAGGAGAMTSTTVATYQYDNSGRLVKVTDPRTNLGTDYTWDGASTRLASITSTGLAGYRLTYDAAPNAPRLAAVSRDNPAGSGPAAILARYNDTVPLSGSGLPDLSTGGPIPLWNQASNPATGYAVFGADYAGPFSGSGVDWTRAQLQYADEQGYTVNTARYGAGAWQLTATDYDSRGNTVRELDAGATATVRSAAAAGDPLAAGQVDALATQTIYNSEVKDSTGAVVTEAGILVTDTYGPVRNAAYTAANGSTVVAPVRPHTHNTYDEGAPNMVNGVATNPATGKPWRLPTTVSTGAAASDATPGQPDLQTSSITVNSYAKLDDADTSEGDPWKLGTPSRVTTGGITRTTRYDTEGRTTQTRQPLSDGTDAGTTKTIYYTAYPNSADPACGNKVEWAGLVCRTVPAAAPSAGAGGAGTLPDARTTAYTAWLQPETVVETSGAVTRTTDTRYDNAGRISATWTSVSGLASSTARPGTFTHYRAADGLVDYRGSLNPAKTDADPAARTSTSYDAWGRPVSTTNDLGDVTTTSYVPPGTPGAGRVASVADPLGTTSYGYDGTDAAGHSEHRGLVTSQSITRPGAGGVLTFRAAYDADRHLVTQQLPGQITQTTGYDDAGEPETLTYSGMVQPVKLRPLPDENGNPVYEPDGPALVDQPWLAWSVVNDVQGRVRSESTGPSAGFDGNPGVTAPNDITGYDSGRAVGYDRAYSYDAAGRLTRVVDHTASGHGADLDASPCVVRGYAFDDNGRRTTLTTSTHSDGDCTGTTGITSSSVSSNYYDTADRPTRSQGGTSQYSYDALGRQTSIPVADAPNPAAGDITLGYFDDDLPRTITQGGTSTVFALDSANRRLTATTTTSAGTSTLVRHYTDDTDNPAWTVATDPGGHATTTRYATSIGGDLGATIGADGASALTLANLHGDIATTVPIAGTAASGDPAGGIAGWSDYTEYGTPRDASSTAGTGGIIGYGWLGAKQRATTSDTAGLTLMGDRLYNPTTGRFTSLDPEPGGNDNRYTYPLDPINMYDLDGHWGFKKWLKKHSSWVHAAVKVAVDIGAGVAAAAACGATAGIGCVIIGGALIGSVANTYAQYRTSRYLGERVTARRAAWWALGGAFAGGIGALRSSIGAGSRALTLDIQVAAGDDLRVMS